MRESARLEGVADGEPVQPGPARPHASDASGSLRPAAAASAAAGGGNYSSKSRRSDDSSRQRLGADGEPAVARLRRATKRDGWFDHRERLWHRLHLGEVTLLGACASLAANRRHRRKR